MTELLLFDVTVLPLTVIEELDEDDAVEPWFPLGCAGTVMGGNLWTTGFLMTDAWAVPIVPTTTATSAAAEAAVMRALRERFVRASIFTP